MAQANSTGSGNLGYDALVMRDAQNDVGGQPNGGAAGANKLWLPLWSGEVIHAYDQYNMFENMITTKSLTGGYSYEFPVTGTIALNPSWDAGEELIGGDAASTTFKVNLDKRPMAAHFECDNVDLLVTQWDYRSELARQAGLQLANTRDRQLAVSLLAACAVDSLASDPRGSDFTSNAFQAPGVISTSVQASGSVTETECLAILKEIENYLVACQENDLPVGNVYCVVTPKVFQLIRSLGIPKSDTGIAAYKAGTYASTPLFTASDDYNAGMGIGSGMNMMGDALDYMGVKIVKSNHIPKTNLAASATTQIGSSKYNLNFASTAFDNANGTGFSAFSVYGFLFQTEAVAGLSLQGMKVDTVQDVRRNTQFTVASMMKGTGIIRPELCKALISGTTPTGGTPVVATGREGLRNHLNGWGVTGTAKTDNLTNGFSAEYKVTV
jgi:hypothetical protein